MGERDSLVPLFYGGSTARTTGESARDHICVGDPSRQVAHVTDINTTALLKILAHPDLGVPLAARPPV